MSHPHILYFDNIINYSLNRLNGHLKKRIFSNYFLFLKRIINYTNIFHVANLSLSRLIFSMVIIYSTTNIDGCNLWAILIGSSNAQTILFSFKTQLYRYAQAEDLINMKTEKRKYFLLKHCYNRCNV